LNAIEQKKFEIVTQGLSHITIVRERRRRDCLDLPVTCESIDDCNDAIALLDVTVFRDALARTSRSTV
jgi:hypothetical protein